MVKRSEKSKVFVTYKCILPMPYEISFNSNNCNFNCDNVGSTTECNANPPRYKMDVEVPIAQR